MHSVSRPLHTRIHCLKKILAASLVMVVYTCCGSICARPTTDGDARRVAQGWLRTSRQVFDIRMNRDVLKVDSYFEGADVALYHVVRLKPTGFVITSADDEIEPIIAFADDGTCEFSENNPLFVLVTQDMQARMSSRGSLESRPSRGSGLSAAGVVAPATSEAASKWRLLMDQADVHLYSAAAESPESFLGDVRVPPLLSSRWNQTTEHGYSCYNYFTPQLRNSKILFTAGALDNYPCGCVATAIAQVLYYHHYPDHAPQQSQYAVTIAAVDSGRIYEVAVPLLGGDFKGGPYNWDQMLAVPTEDATEEQRQAVGALCADAGAAVHMTYGADRSGTSMDSISPALRDTFHYESALLGINCDGQRIDNLSSELASMMNPNLDAGSPVILCLLSPVRGHAIVADGYGYNYSSAYYHLNMGWSGVDDAWYNLPHVNPYSLVGACIYNIFPRGGGEIISGRVTDPQDRPVRDATVLLTEGTTQRMAATNERGVYAFTGLASESRCRISVSKPGCTFTPEERIVATGQSVDSSPLCGNVWAVEFTQAGPEDENGAAGRGDGSIETFDDSRTVHPVDWVTDWVLTDTAWTSPAHSMRSKAISDNESSSLSVTLDCQGGDISFYSKLSSEDSYDCLMFRIDGRLQDRWSGEKDWQRVSFPVSAGRHTFQWEYSKDYMLSEGDDCAWLDDISFPISRP